uniref:Glycerophosphodiester phosphodiesterase domain-containing protein 1-like n=1 Tax=Crassostrea virginica TaxID=6565 RepID=A0A8B8EML3_CRAVI|nr:glycerophosphodiester phosphodiesterase domain-containing protein 1-like [Crassostrea virginica]
MEIEYIVAMVLGSVFVGYVVTSLILFRFPTILHKKKRLCFRPAHISHRGGAGENIENTMTAFRHAMSVGTDMLEIDCHLTKDGKVIVSHDSSLKRVCDSVGVVADYDFEDLPLLKESHRLDFKHSFVYDGTGCTDRKFPLLEEVFKEFPKTPINIDIKVDDDELIEKVNDLIVKYNREQITVWGNRSSTVVNKAYALNPNIPVLFSVGGVIKLLVLFYTGLLPFIPLKESLLEVLMPSIFLGDDAPPIISRKLRFLLSIFNILLMRPALFHHLERRGIQTYLWVLNEEHEFERAFKLGATGIMTDFPTKLKEYLDKNPQYRKNTSSESS